MKYSMGAIMKDITLAGIFLIGSQLFVNAQDKARRTQAFKLFESKFPSINLPFKTDTYKTTTKSINNSITNDFVTSIYNGQNVIVPVGKLKYKDYMVLIWQEEMNDHLSWQLSTFRLNGEPIDQLE